MGTYLDTINRRLRVAINILTILTFGPCAILAPRPLVAILDFRVRPPVTAYKMLFVHLERIA